VTDHVLTASAAPAYGRFSRRLRAVVIDWAIMMLLLVLALLVAVSTNSDRVGRILGFSLVAIWLLYEPFLVCLTGSTVGHYLSNLRVVDDRSHGNIGFLKALARLVIKSVLGIYSFITMATTSRHQAVHDLMTRSTVQIRDLSKANSNEYVTERTELLRPTMPSRLRRVIVIFGYILAFSILYGIAAVLLNRTGIVSQSCFDNLSRCPRAEYPIAIGFSLLWWVVMAFCIVQGWRGRLYGCRRRAIDNDRPPGA